MTAGAIALLAIASTGCGSDSQADSDATAVSPAHAKDSRADSDAPAVSPAYTKVVTGLRGAALSNTAYHAARRARRLAKPERAVIDAFCLFAWQIPVDHLVYLLDQHVYVVGRITHLAELNYRGASAGYYIEDAPIKASMGRLRTIVDLRSLNGHLIRRYSRACYR